MKVLIMEINNNEAIVLSRDGIFSSIKDKGYKVGERAEINNGIKNLSEMLSKKRLVAIVTVLALIIASSVGFAYLYNTPYSYASVDINPSLTIELNIFDRVVNIEGVNSDGEKMSEELKLENMNLAEAVDEIVNYAIEEGYIVDDDENAVVLTINSKNEKKEEKLMLKAMRSTEKAVLNNNVNGKNLEVEVLGEKIGYNRVLEARELNVSPGKLNLVQKYTEATGEEFSEEMLEWPVKQLRKPFKNNSEKGNKGRGNNGGK